MTVLAVALLCMAGAAGAETVPGLPLTAGVFDQQVHRAYTVDEGLPCNDVRRIDVDGRGGVVVETARGAAEFRNGRWHATAGGDPVAPSRAGLGRRELARLERAAGAPVAVRDVARHEDEVAVAADTGLYVGDGRNWRMVMPREGSVRWAPVDVRAVAYDATGALWFAAPQGAGRRAAQGEWKLFTGAEGLPCNDFTCMAAGPKGVWFGTMDGAIHYRDGLWSFRQGRRWLLDGHVRDIAVDAAGNAWVATAAGVSFIASEPMTLAGKASFYEAEIELYHRRTEFGFVCPAELARPGDKATATPVYTDNDGHFTGLYLGAASLAYAVTGDPARKRDAANAFRALAFLGEVTEGGTHPAPRGFVARAVVPVDGPDPNPRYDLAYDRRRNEADALWKVIQPRWPVDASGAWYWKNDTSSDELDGHFFGCAVYFDRACETDAERDAVRAVVRRIMDHILDHDYNLVDHDGRPTRWARFSPDDLNRNPAWCDERGLNSFSVLTYLAVTHHITGDSRYREAYLELAFGHGYGMNGMTQPKCLPGPDGMGHQPDDNMAFMNYYHLIRYESDPRLLSMYYHAIRTHWQYERLERNPFANFVYAACCLGKVRRDHWGETDLSPPADCFEDSLDTLRRYPLDLVDWPVSTAHRIDALPVRDADGWKAGAGRRRDGEVFPIDERHETAWDLDPWTLVYEGRGTHLRHGVPYLLAYYLGRAHGFIVE